MADRNLPHPDPSKFNEAIRRFRRLVPVTDAEFKRLDEDAQREAFKIANVNSADVVLGVYEELARAIEDGTSFQDSKARIVGKLVEEWGMADSWRVETIFRTNVQRAYNDARYEVMTAPTVLEDRPYWRFDAIDDQRTTDICQRLDGTVRPADDPFWKTHSPPTHFNCRSTLVPLTREEAEEEGITPEPPDSPPAEGFGHAPNTRGANWEPDYSQYPEDVAKELQRRVAGG